MHLYVGWNPSVAHRSSASAGKLASLRSPCWYGLTNAHMSNIDILARLRHTRHLTSPSELHNSRECCLKAMLNFAVSFSELRPNVCRFQRKLA